MVDEPPMQASVSVIKWMNEDEPERSGSRGDHRILPTLQRSLRELNEPVQEIGQIFVYWSPWSGKHQRIARAPSASRIPVQDSAIDEIRNVADGRVL